VEEEMVWDELYEGGNGLRHIEVTERFEGDALLKLSN
jgi:hypothetical protein